MRPAAQRSALAGSPVLIGAVTTLVTVVAVFLAYNANSGLPFVPSYEITVQVPDAAGLVKGNDVRIGGKRIGTIERIEGHAGGERPYAELDLKLDKPVEPLLDDSTLIVRPRSPLGLKYLEIDPGESGRPVKAGGELRLPAARESVDLDEVLDTFDRTTRESLQRTLGGLGTGFAGRGQDFNQAVADAPDLVLQGEHLGANLSHPRTGLRRTVRSLDRVTAELAPIAPQVGSLVASADTTTAALAGVLPELSQTLAGLPPVAGDAIATLRLARPLLVDARELVADLRPGAASLKPAAAGLHSALRRGTPVLRRASALADRLRGSLVAVDDLASDPLTTEALSRLRVALDSLRPTLRYVVPAQARCNYVSLWFRNAASSLSEGDAGGTWLRTLVLARPTEAIARSDPAPNIHHNGYAYAGGPGTGGDCEAGNEPFEPGSTFGNLPGVQATGTEDTGLSPEEGGR
ncbi:MAG TPA: MlaD family protein [Thermoleophilaceae bacterium]|jgi:virulence factor Mce-like protein